MRPSKFSTHLLDQALTERRKAREQMRQAMLADVQRALAELQLQYPFAEAYLFGSLIKPERFHENSDIDIAISGLNAEHFFPALAWLMRRLERDVDLIDLDTYPHKERILREAYRWTKPE